MNQKTGPFPRWWRQYQVRCTRCVARCNWTEHSPPRHINGQWHHGGKLVAFHSIWEICCICAFSSFFATQTLTETPSSALPCKYRSAVDFLTCLKQNDQNPQLFDAIIIFGLYDTHEKLDLYLLVHNSPDNSMDCLDVASNVAVLIRLFWFSCWRWQKKCKRSQIVLIYCSWQVTLVIVQGFIF